MSRGFDSEDEQFGGRGSMKKKGLFQLLFWYESFEQAFDHLKWLCFMILIGLPFFLGAVWNVRSEGNAPNAIGIAVRNGAGAFIQETTPFAESMLNATQGKGFRSGKVGREDKQPLREQN